MTTWYCRSLGVQEWPHLCAEKSIAGESLIRVYRYIDQHAGDDLDSLGVVPNLVDDLLDIIIYLGSLEERIQEHNST